MENLQHYLFVEQYSGEQFLVGAYDLSDAVDILYNICENHYLDIEEFSLLEDVPEEEFDMVFVGTLSDEEAEASGLDEF